MSSLDADKLASLRSLIQSGVATDARVVDGPITAIDSATIKDPIPGWKAIQGGQVACLLVAGGQGTRLGFDGPKGCYPITAEGKSLFELVCEKVAALSGKLGIPLPFAVMTSPGNDAETRAFFDAHANWGLVPEQIHFFQQSEELILSEQGETLRDASGAYLKGPDGNGTALKALHASGILDHWAVQGVRWIQWILVDNPLALPYDPWLATYHLQSGDDVVIKACERRDVDEKVGLLANLDGGVGVVEYTELPESMRRACVEDGSLLFKTANMSLFSFSLDFARSSALDYTDRMPWHLAHKAVRHWMEDGVEICPEHPNAWKFEKFIFDLLPFA
ncbi:MAG: UTP--glucose-1-phosphate uridylyltransferase, partial [Chlamydiia bacterium]|nr:UTP--glucose-1-phosphate uridylyltransferase [Chlamydiia bacterium]